MSYTPGPYHVGLPGGPAGPFWSLVNSEGNVVAMQVTTAENARLLASSPDLLRALDNAVDLLTQIAEGAIAPDLTQHYIGQALEKFALIRVTATDEASS